MLSKLKDIEIPPDKPFDNDALGLESIAENLTKLIHSTTEPFVFSINSPWGGGKTTFIKMWMQSLISLGHPTFYFNAWETDFTEIPLVSFIGEVRNFIETQEPAGENRKKKIEKVKKINGNLSKAIAPLLVKYLSRNAMDIEAFKTLLDIDDKGKNEISIDISKLAEKGLSQFREQTECINEFKTQLAEAASNLISLEDGQGPFIIFVDELDRCRPSYAIELLENIKHLFSVPNIVFVLGIDSGQLQHMVKSLYGVGMDAEGYLKRFIDLEFTLPKPELNPEDQRETFPSHLFHQFQIDKLFEAQNKGVDEHYNIVRIFSELSELFNFSLRDQIQCFTQINLTYQAVGVDSNYAYYLIFLICLKAKNRTLYYRLNDKMTTTEEIFDFLLEGREESVLFSEKSRVWTVIEAIIIQHLNKESISEYIKDKTKTGAISVRTKQLQEYTSISGVLTELRRVQRQMFDKVEFTSNFTL